MITIQTYQTINPGAWQDLLDRAPNASCFQSKACYDFYSKLKFIEPFVYAVSEDDQLVGLACGYLVADGGVLKQFFSRRAIIPGGLLLDEKISDEALKSLLHTMQRALSSKAIYIEIRNYNDYTSYRESMLSTGFSYQQHLNIQVATPDVETAFSKLSTTKRRQVKQTEKAGVICEASTQPDDLQAFYRMLQKLYQTKVKKPLFPFAFFEALLKQDFARFFVVKKADHVLGGIVCVQSEKVVYEWFICGEDNSTDKIFPSVLATWKAIEYAAGNGFAYFDFMGAGKLDEPYGVREFKSKFGGALLEQGRFLYLCQPGLYHFSKTMLQIIRKIL